MHLGMITHAVTSSPEVKGTKEKRSIDKSSKRRLNVNKKAKGYQDFPPNYVVKFQFDR